MTREVALKLWEKCIDAVKGSLATLLTVRIERADSAVGAQLPMTHSRLNSQETETLGMCLYRTSTKH